MFVQAFLLKGKPGRFSFGMGKPIKLKGVKAKRHRYGQKKGNQEKSKEKVTRKIPFSPSEHLPANLAALLLGII